MGWRRLLHQLRQARQHHPGVRIRAGHRVHGGVRRRSGARAILMGEDVNANVNVSAGDGAVRELRGTPVSARRCRDGAGRAGRLQRPLRSGPHPRRVLPARPRAARRELRRPDPGAQHRQGGRRHRVDAARDARRAAWPPPRFSSIAPIPSWCRARRSPDCRSSIGSMWTSRGGSAPETWSRSFRARGSCASKGAWTREVRTLDGGTRRTGGLRGDRRFDPERTRATIGRACGPRAPGTRRAGVLIEP